VQHIVRSTPEAALWRPGLALLLSELDLRDEARAEFEVLAQNDFAAIPRDGSWSTCCVYLAEVCAYLGDGERAATLYALLEPCAGRNIIAPPNVACFGAATHFLGMLAATMQKWSLAQPAFEAALELNMRQGAKPSLAFTQYQYAVMLLRRGETGDRERARALLQAAEATSGALGMATLRERSADVQLKLTAEPERLRYPAGLSQREVEVLRLVAAGKNNREVAQRLFVSPNTVANHVRAILTKTETSNRTEAAAFAFKHDLLKG
jgi:DNA-binding NarL/FixJ family response regulator